VADSYVAVKGGTQPVFLRGLAKYSKLGASLDQFGKNSIRIYPDTNSMNAIHKLISEGIKNKLNKDDDGYSITFSRPMFIKTKSKGEVLLEPVIVTDEEDIVLEDKYIEDGTEITIKLETYGGKSPTGFGSYKAARLAQVKIHGKKAARTIPF
jgi:hypothetical protein